MFGQSSSILQLGWLLLSLLTMEERLARLVEGGSSVSREDLGVVFGAAQTKNPINHSKFSSHGFGKNSSASRLVLGG